MKIKVYEGIFVVSLIMILGTVGACDFGSITLIHAIIQGAIFTGLTFLSIRLMNVEYAREAQREKIRKLRRKLQKQLEQ